VKRGIRERLLCACAIASPVVWFGLLCTAWAIAPAPHQPGRLGLLLGLHALALAAAGTPGAAACRELRRLRRVSGSQTSHDPPLDAPADRLGLELAAEHARFLVGAALALSATSVAIVLASAVPLLLLTPGVEL
jgi:hypothetical protein